MTTGRYLELLARLESLVREAERLVARREGVHDMHQAAAIVRGFFELVRDHREEVPVERAAALVANMRICVRKGFFPKVPVGD